MLSMRPGFQTPLIYVQLANWPKTNPSFYRFAQYDRLTSVDRHVLVVLLKILSVLGDFNGFRIEDANRHVLTAKFNRTISRRDPSFEGSFSVVAERYPHVSSFERLNGDSI